MKVGVIGAGFYGVYLARALQGTHSVTLFEQSDAPLQRSGRINQCRLHRGYHYPRCRETLAQTSNGFEKFQTEFGAFTSAISNNIYAFHKDGKSQVSDLQKNSLGLNLSIRPAKAPLGIKNPENYSAFLQTDERLIHLGELRTHLLDTYRSKLQLHARAIHVDTDSGTIHFADGSKENFDWVINTSFTEPNLGLPKERAFQYSLELAAMAILPLSSYPDGALTIMDGDFISFYPTHDQKVSLSSVPYTPFFITTDVEEFRKAWDRRFEIAQEKQTLKRIITHGNQFIDFNPGETPELWIAPKTRLTELRSDGKPSRVRVQGKLISIFCGKLDSIYSVREEISQLTEGLLR